MEWLDAHNGAVQAVATVIQVLVTIVLVVITVYYALQTRKQATAAQDALAAQDWPMLVPQPVPHQRDGLQPHGYLLHPSSFSSTGQLTV